MRPRYDYARNMGRAFFNSLNLDRPPINPFLIIKQRGWEYEIQDLEGEDGYTFYNPNKDKYKVYIDSEAYKYRANFTAGHEIAHIILGHFKHSNLTDDQNDILDIEANLFCTELLMPKVLINNLQSRYYTSEELAVKFSVSKKAMEYRIANLGIDLTKSLIIKKSKIQILEELKRYKGVNS